MYTSGTTDRPKGVMHSYANFYWKCADHVVALGLSAEDRLLVTGPLYHVGAFDLPGMAVLWVGGMLYIHRDFDPRARSPSIESEKLTGAWLAPVMLTRSCSHSRAHFDRCREPALGDRRRRAHAGSPHPRILRPISPTARYIDAYGLTETCSGDTLMEAGPRDREDRLGRPRARRMSRSRSATTTGNCCRPARRARSACAGRRSRAATGATRRRRDASFFGDWFRTGDVGYLDADGFLYLTDRKKDMIISGGENIASSEVERVIYRVAGGARGRPSSACLTRNGASGRSRWWSCARRKARL